MLLEKQGHFNDLSPQLRKELEEKIRGFGKQVIYKFEISHANPDPTAHNGKVIWPNMYTLDPVQFNINDPHEKRDGVSKSKKISLVDGLDDKGIPNKFRKIRVEGKFKGQYILNLADNPEHLYYAMYLELHPKLTGGKFADKSKQQVFSRVDENALATEQRKERSVRKLAMDTAERMSDAEIKEFADAMGWDSTDSVIILKNKAEEMAEQSPEMFNDLVSDKKMKYQASVKRAVDKGIWKYDPVEGILSWASTSQPIAVMGPTIAGRTDYERLAEWFLTAGKKADDAYNKMLTLEKEPALK